MEEETKLLEGEDESDVEVHIWVDARETTGLITIHQMHRRSHMAIHYDSSSCSILGAYPWIDARETTGRITIHQMHSYAHIDVHHDSSLCSTLGVYPHISLSISLPEQPSSRMLRTSCQ